VLCLGKEKDKDKGLLRWLHITMLGKILARIALKKSASALVCPLDPLLYLILLLLLLFKG